MVDCGTALAGKAVVITGAGGGLGAAYARHAAAYGASVVVNDVNKDMAHSVAAEINKTGGSALAHVADVSDWEASKGIIDRCIEEFGAIDGLVNNAGIAELARPEEQTELGIRRHIEVNVYGTFFPSVHAVRYMTGQGSGSIVNVTSGAQAGLPLEGAYGASKGAVAALTYCWAIDLRESGVRVNAISPHGTTPMIGAFERYYASKGVEGGLTTAGLDYPDTPAESNAPVVTFLLSDLSGGVNGQVVRMERGTLLSLMSHPGVLSPPLQRDDWTFDDICRAFEEDLAARQQPLGVVALNVSPAGSRLGANG